MTRSDTIPGEWLIAPHSAQLVGQLMAELASPATVEALRSAEAKAASADGGDFWTELGPSKSSLLRPYRVRDGVLRIPVKGVLLHGFPYQYFGVATGYEYLTQALARALDDENVSEIALDISSPGGMVAGCFDCADGFFEARGSKRIVAYANEHAYSAAYAIASAADQVVVARTGGVGSIGVVSSHVDASRYFENLGLKTTLICAGDKKVDGNPYEPLPDAVKADIQERVDALYSIFVSTVARNRGLSEAAVRATQAATFMAPGAVERGLADLVGPFASLSARADSSKDKRKEITMSKENQSVETAEHTQAVEAARTEGFEKGKAEGRAEGIAAERARIAAILGSDEAASRPNLAREIALKTDMDAEAAASVLAAAAEETRDSAANAANPLDEMMAASEQPNLGAMPNTGAAAEDDDESFMAQYRSLTGRA